MVKLWLIRFQCAGFFISTGLPCVNIYLTICALISSVHKAQIPEHNCCISQGLSVVGDIQVKTPTRNRSLCYY